MWEVSGYRSIPAGAGETSAHSVSAVGDGVDPRGCGGDATSNALMSHGPGRSPRVRGRQRRHRQASHAGGSIPAGAGETTQAKNMTSKDRVDPRGCGGDFDLFARDESAKGRSPRVRGRPVHRIESNRALGSIPAGAGETLPHPTCDPWPGVDPRGCGGDSPAPQYAVTLPGRSPRVRGRPGGGRSPLAAPGSIPAGAGETVVVAEGDVRVGVDPRGCGGDGGDGWLGYDVRGRSPRVRGRPPSR